uniref:Uncharacterized protein n=1 Tax=Gorilla gorilla gorilla TaxID=9595 RepID=A0A2I2Z515_GORGO
MLVMAQKTLAPFYSFSPRSLAQMPEFPPFMHLALGLAVLPGPYCLLPPVACPRGHTSKASASVDRQKEAKLPSFSLLGMESPAPGELTGGSRLQSSGSPPE